MGAQCLEECVKPITEYRDNKTFAPHTSLTIAVEHIPRIVTSAKDCRVCLFGCVVRQREKFA